MLKIEDLKEVTGLEGISPAHLDIIVNMSKIDEDKVIGARIGQMYGDMDNDLKALGFEKQTGESSYKAVSRIIEDLKGKTDHSKYKTQLTELTATNADLLAKVKAGGDEGLKSKYTELEKRLSDKDVLISTMREAATKSTGEWETKYGEEVKRNAGIMEDNLFNQAIAGFKFIDDSTIPKGVRDAYIKAGKTAVKSQFTLEWRKGDDGGEPSPVFIQDGQIKYDQENGFKPITAATLLKNQLSAILDKGRAQTGAGGNAGGAGGAPIALNLAGIGNQIAADKAISEYLTAEGFVKGTQDFAAKQLEIRKEAKVSALPEKE